MVTFVFNKNKSSLLDNELYYSHDEEQTNAIYKLVTEDTWPGNGATRRLKTTRLYRDTNIYPVGEISLRWKEKHHAVVSGKRSLKPTANTFGNGLYVCCLCLFFSLFAEGSIVTDPSMVLIRRTIHGRNLLLDHGLYVVICAEAL